jgi:pyruvate formate lyase activating enzyme
MIFKGWQKTSLIDYPDKISTVLFCGGCNFRCPFCYNFDLVLHPDELVDLRGEMVLEYLSSNRSLYQAVVVTGGEPILHIELPQFLEAIKELGLLAGIETNGSRPDVLGELIDGALVDFVAMDVKAPLLFDKYCRASGISDEGIFKAVLESVDMLIGSEVDYELRVTVVPGIHQLDDVLQLGSQLRGARRVVIQQFLPERTLDRKLQSTVPYSKDQFFYLQRELKKSIANCTVRNL